MKFKNASGIFAAACMSISWHIYKLAHLQFCTRLF